MTVRGDLGPGGRLDPARVGAGVEECRTAAGVSVEQAAAAADLDLAEYRRVEAGERLLNGAELVCLADLFGVRAGVILGPRNPETLHLHHGPGDGLSDAAVKHLEAYHELDQYLTGHAF